MFQTNKQIQHGVVIHRLHFFLYHISDFDKKKSIFFFQSAITHPKKFVTAPLTKYVFNYVSKTNILYLKKYILNVTYFR